MSGNQSSLFPYPRIGIAVCQDIDPLSMGQIILEFSLVKIPICVVVFSLSVEHIFQETPFEFVTVVIDQFSPAIRFPVPEFAGINITLGRGEDSPSMHLVLEHLSFIFIAIGPYLGNESGNGFGLLGARIGGAVC